MGRERDRKIPIQVYLSDNEKYVLDNKVRASGIRADYEAMLTRKHELEKTYKSAENVVKQLQQQIANVQQYIGTDNSRENRNTLRQYEQVCDQTVR